MHLQSGDYLQQCVLMTCVGLPWSEMHSKRVAGVMAALVLSKIVVGGRGSGAKYRLYLKILMAGLATYQL